MIKILMIKHPLDI